MGTAETCKTVFVVTQYFWPEPFLINELVTTLTNDGYKVIVFTGQPNYPGGKVYPGYRAFKTKTEAYNGATVHRTPLIPRGKNPLQLIANYLSFVVFGCLNILRYRRYRPDIIFVYEPSPVTVGLPAIALSAFTKAPILMWVQDIWPDTLAALGTIRSGFMLKAVGQLSAHIHTKCRLILITSRGFRAKLTQQGVDPQNIRYLPQWAPPTYCSVSIPSRESVDSDLPDGFIVMYAGNIGQAQAFDTVLKAAELLSEHADIHWVILGDGRMKAWVSQEVERLNLSRQFSMLGSRPSEEMPRYFAAADAMLVTLKRKDIFKLTVPLKLQSYLACGRPIIGAIEGEGAAVIDDAGAGIVCEPENAVALAEAVLRLYGSPAQVRHTMGIKAREYYENNFEMTKSLRSLKRWFNEVSQ